MALGLCDVSRESFEQILCKQGRGNIAIVAVGGAAESLDAHPGFYKLTLKNRKGFVKMAIRTGWVTNILKLVIFSSGVTTMGSDRANPGIPNPNGQMGAPKLRL